MRRALVLSALPTAGMSAWLFLRPEHIAQAPLYLALAALGLNILTGYAGQLSLGSAAFMAVFGAGTLPMMLA